MAFSNSLFFSGGKLLGVGDPPLGAEIQPSGPQDLEEASARFSALLADATQGSTSAPQAAQPTQGVPGVQAPAATIPTEEITRPRAQLVPSFDGMGASAQARARKALGLPGPATGVDGGGGDTILSGLQRLRTIFSSRVSNLNRAVSGPMDNVEALMNVQLEVLKFTLTVDVASKMIGKSTQAFETLLKGQ